MNLQKQLVFPTKTASVLIHSLFVLLWFSPLFLRKMPMNAEIITIFDSIKLFSVSPKFAIIFQFFFYLIFSLIINFNLKILKVISPNNFMFYYLFMFFLCITDFSQTINNEFFAFIFFIIAVFQAFKNYQSEGVFRAFNSMLFLCLAILLKKEFIVFIPFIWISFIIFKSLTYRTFFASVFAIFLTLLTIYSISFLFNKEEIINEYFLNFPLNFDFQNLNFKLENKLFFPILSLFSVIYITRISNKILDFNNQVRSYYNVAIFMIPFMILFLIIENKFNNFNILVLWFSFLGTLFYNLKANKFSKILLISFIILGISYKIFNI